jgi:hypothetical protein
MRDHVLILLQELCLNFMIVIKQHPLLLIQW